MKCSCMTTFNRRCKNKTLYNRMCFIHFKKYYSNYIIKIQSIWRSHLTRKKIKSLYINLPSEIQNIVVYFMREEYRADKLRKSYSKIYYTKIHNLEYKLSSLYFHYQTTFSYDFEDYIDQKIKIKDKINYFRSRINEIT